MNETQLPPYTAFEGHRCVASGSLEDVVRASKEVLDQKPHASLLLFDNATCRQVEVDFRGTTDEVLARLPQPENQPEEPTVTNTEEVKPGRPKLGVVPREVTLLPRHWDWLATQPGGASVTLRKLVEEARRSSLAADQKRQAQESVNRFMMVVAGNLPGFEEASRAFYRGERERFEQIIGDWPPDVRQHLTLLAAQTGW